MDFITYFVHQMAQYGGLLNNRTELCHDICIVFIT
jgi:hypothetical protein